MTKNKSGGGYHSDNHGFPNVIDIEKQKVLERSEKLFHQFGTFRAIVHHFESWWSRNDEIPKSSFPFRPQTKNGKKVWPIYVTHKVK